MWRVPLSGNMFRAQGMRDYLNSKLQTYPCMSLEDVCLHVLMSRQRTYYDGAAIYQVIKYLMPVATLASSAVECQKALNKVEEKYAFIKTRSDWGTEYKYIDVEVLFNEWRKLRDFVDSWAIPHNHTEITFVRVLSDDREYSYPYEDLLKNIGVE